MKEERKEKRIGRGSVRLPAVRRELGDYVLLEEVGEGAFAKVRLCHGKKDGEKRVMKIYDKFRLHTEEKRKRVGREIEILKGIGHPGVIRLLDSFETADAVCLVMELFSLTSLTAYVRLNRPLPECTLREVTRQLAQALAYLHEKGIAHRDIKPDNILIDEAGRVKLIDLGLATDGHIKEVQVAGTPHFMAPELLKSAKYDPMRADLWALGVLLYWLALGYYPGDTKNSRDTRRKGVPKLQFPVDMHPGIEYLISKLMREEPTERATAEEVLEDTWVQPRDFRQEISRLTRQLAKH